MLLLKNLSLIGSLLALISQADSVPTDTCTATAPDGPILVTANCTDSDYVAVIDDETDEVSPFAHRKVAGHFNGTESRFNIYLPNERVWEGRFFQLVYPTQTENATEETIAFGAESGGYTVQINGGTGYRADAAAAKFSREIAADFYRHHEGHIHGYIYGGSGGSLQTVGALENTEGVWDGAVPIIQAVPISFMNNPTPRGLAGLVLRNKSAEIENAVKPGGSMNPYIGLNSVQHEILKEATQLGNPILSWQDFSATADMTDLSKLNYDVRGLDPTYVDDFWNEPGYLGSEKSPLGDLLRAQLIDQFATITFITRDNGKPTNITLDIVPTEEYRLGLDFTLHSHNGSEIGLIRGVLDGSMVRIEASTENTTLEALDKGLRVRIDNRWFIAMHAYYRHQVPTRDGYYGWDYLRNSTGHPIYVQRPLEVSVAIAKAAAGGGTHTGKIRCKVIVVDNLLDEQAYPWHADWYREQVRKYLGNSLDDSYRLWYNENADHDLGAVEGTRASRVVEFTGIYHQALRDLAAWVENSDTPPRSTNYTISPATQVQVPADVSQRFGIQPSVELSISGRDCAEAMNGSLVLMDVYAEVPPDAGSIISVEWDYMGTGQFVRHELHSATESLHLKGGFKYTRPGIYFPAARVTAHRDGNMTTPFRRVSNLGRARIVVS